MLAAPMQYCPAPAIERIENSPIQELVTTNTIPMGDKKSDKIKVLSVGTDYRRSNLTDSFR